MIHRIRVFSASFGFMLAACAPTPPADSPSAVHVGEPTDPPTASDTADDPAVDPTDCAALAKELRCEQREDAWGCVDKRGNVVLPFEYLSISPFSPAGIAAVVHSQHGPQYVDATGKLRYEAFNFENGPDELSDGRARFVQDGKIGFVDENFEIAIPAQYDSAMYFDEGTARVCIGCDPRIWKKDAPEGLEQGRVFYIDTTGKEVPEPKR